MGVVAVVGVRLVLVRCRWCRNVPLGEVEEGARYRLRCHSCRNYREGIA